MENPRPCVSKGLLSAQELMASEQGFYAIAAALRSVRGESSLYRMTDAVPAAQPDKAPAAPASSGNGLAGKDPAVQKTSVTAPGTTFPDIIGHARSEEHTSELQSRQ